MLVFKLFAEMEDGGSVKQEHLTWAYYVIQVLPSFLDTVHNYLVPAWLFHIFCIARSKNISLASSSKILSIQL